MAITVNEPDYLSSFYVPLFNPILFAFTATAGETKIIIQVKNAAGTILQDNIILLFASDNTVVFDASPYLKPSNSNALNAGEYTADINDTNSIIEFYLSWDEYPQPSPTSFENTNNFFATNAVLQIGNTAGNNLYNQIPLTGKEGVFLTEFDNVRHWEGYPQTLSFITNLGGLKKITTSSGSTVSPLAGNDTVMAILLPDEGEDYTIQVIDGVSFQTEWNTGTDGNFGSGSKLTSTPTSGTTIWVLDDGTEVTSNNLDTALGGYDGTLKTAGIIGALDSLSIRNSKCLGALDLSRQNFNGNVLIDEFLLTTYGFSSISFSDNNTLSVLSIQLNPNLTTLDLTGIEFDKIAGSTVTVRVESCANITGITFSNDTNEVTTWDTDGSTSLTALDCSSFTWLAAAVSFTSNSCSALTSFTQFTGGTLPSFQLRASSLTSIDISNTLVTTTILIDNSVSNSLTSVTLSSSAASIVTLGLSDNALTTFNLGGVVFDSNLVTYDVRNNGASQALVDSWLSRDDAAASGGSTGTMKYDGTNAAPTGGAANANVVSLVGKGFTVIHS